MAKKLTPATFEILIDLLFTDTVLVYLEANPMYISSKESSIYLLHASGVKFYFGNDAQPNHSCFSAKSFDNLSQYRISTWACVSKWCCGLRKDKFCRAISVTKTVEPCANCIWSPVRIACELLYELHKDFRSTKIWTYQEMEHYVLSGWRGYPGGESPFLWIETCLES